MDSILAQTHPIQDMEVIIADGGSSDGTRQVIQAFARQHSELRLKLVGNPAGTIPAGLNKAISEANGSTIVRLDAHSRPHVDYIERSLEILAATRAANVGGMWEIRPSGDGWMSRSIAKAGASWLGAGDARYRVGGEPGPVDTVPFGAYRKEWLDKIGPFDETLLTNEDYEYNYRIRQAGGVVWFDPGIRSLYFARSSLSALARQYARYGHWKARMLLKHPQSIRWRQLIPGGFVLTVLILAAVSMFSAGARPLLAAMLGIYAAVVLTAGAYFAAQMRDIGMLVGYPLAIAVMHFAWGGAFLWGLMTGAAEKLSGQS